MRWPARVLTDKSRLLNSDEARSPQQALVLDAMARADQFAGTVLSRAAFDSRPPTAAVSSQTAFREFLLMTVGDTCNLACRYCYEADRRKRKPPKRMELSTLERVLLNSLPYVSPPFLIAWHGGEPLLMGKEYFAQALGLVHRIAGGDWARQAVQTNATLVDGEWAGLFRDNNVSVGISVEADPASPVQQRVFPDGTGSCKAVSAGIEALRNAAVPFAAIVVVPRDLASSEGSARRVFRYLGDLGIRNFDVHPAFTPIAPARAANVSAVEYAAFMIELFEAWLDEADNRIRISFFEHVLQGMTGQRPDTCYLSGSCTSIIGIDSDGFVIPCTRPFDPLYTFGNLAEQTLPAIADGAMFQRFKIEEFAGRLRTRECKWRNICSAGCPHDRAHAGSQAVDGDNVYCTCHGDSRGGYPEIFTYIQRRVATIVSGEGYDSVVPDSTKDI